jgi:hypothetical protein
MAGRMQGKLMLLFMVACFSVAGFSSAGTPQQALVEIATASKAATVEKHLPELLRQTLQRLSPEDRALAEQKLLITLIAEGTQLIVPDDGQSLLVMEKKGSDDRLVIRVIHEINAGGEALLELGVEHSENYTQTVFVSMRLEEDEWRATRVDVRVSLNGLHSVIRNLRNAFATCATKKPREGFSESCIPCRELSINSR